MAIAKQNRKKSFFAEQREGNTNPNFINNLDYTFLRNSVKRILKDVSDNLIIPEDYIYFKSNNVINACLQEAYENYQSNKTLRLALTAYRGVILPQRYVTPDVDINTEYTTSGIELTKATDREMIWWSAWSIFDAISKGADPQQSLMNIQRIQKQSIRSL